MLNIDKEEKITVSLKKGQTVSFKKNKNFKEIQVGLDWTKNCSNKNSNESDFDADLVAIMLGNNGKVKRATDIVFFGNYYGTAESILHLGDNKVGSDPNEKDLGNDNYNTERINMFLEKIPMDVTRIVLLVTIYEANTRKQNFGLIKNASIVVNEINGSKPLVKYDLSEDYTTATAIEVGEFFRKNDGWDFETEGIAYYGKEIQDITPMYGIYSED